MALTGGRRMRSAWIVLIVAGLSLGARYPSAAVSQAVLGPTTLATSRSVERTEASARASLLQFRSQGHLLGFTEGRMYTVGVGYVLVEEFVGANPVPPQAPPTGALADAKGTPPLQSVTYRHLWDGITVAYTTSPAGLAMSTYRLEPHADPRSIRLRYSTDVALQPDGSLRVQHPTARGFFALSAPRAWQEIGGRRTPVAVAFSKPEQRLVGFSVGSYDATQPLLIDPTYTWHTFQGSSANDTGYDIAIDGDGNLYVTGTSDAGWGTPLHPHSGAAGGDLVAMKFDSTGALLWHTFYGSATYDDGRGIAVDGSGSVYVTGFSGGTWGSPLHPFSAPAGSTDLVVLKLDGAGALQWHTFYGSSAYGDFGAADSYGVDVAVDAGGDVNVAGHSFATWSGPGGEPPLHAHGGIWNIVVLKLTSAGVYRWHTFHGSGAQPNGADAQSIAVDGSGNVYVAGESWLPWNGPGGQAPLQGHSGIWNLVVLKLTSAGAYQWHTFYRAAGRDIGIAADHSANVYVTGFSATSWGTPLQPHSGDWDIVVIKLDSSGAYQWHTFHGSAGPDDGFGVAVDGSGNAYITGYSSGTWGTPLQPHGGDRDIVVMKLDSAGAYQWHTFFGSSSPDDGRDIAVDSSGNAYVTGMSWSSWGTPLDPHWGITGNADIVVLKLAGDPGPGPDPFTFTDVTGVPVSTEQVSNSIAVAGIATPVPISVSGDPSSEYAINGGAWTSAAASVNNGDTVQVRHVSAATYGASLATTLTIGGVSDTFTSTTTTIVTGDLTIVGTTATVIDISSLATVGGDVQVSGNTSATVIDMSSLATVGGDVEVSGNTSATVIDMSSLATVGGDVEISGNTSVTVIDMSSTTTVGGDVEVGGNTSATLIDMSLTGTVGGDIIISGNTSATAIDMGSLTTVGGNVEVSGNTTATSIDMSSTATVSGDVTVVDNGDATVNMSAGATVSGDLTIETTGTESFALGDATVTGDLTLDASGYTDISGTTPGGALDLTATNLGALMHVQLQAGSFTTPVTFSVTRLDPTTLVPESGLDAEGGPATIDPVAASQFTFAIPTLNHEAALSFDIDVAALDAVTQTAFLEALAAGTATLVTRGDADGSVYQAFPTCQGAEPPTVDGCVRVEAFDAAGQPTSDTPARVRFGNVVGHFSTWAVAIVTPTRHRLTVTTAGTGTGTVTSSPAGIACPGDCTDDYDAGTVVTLTAAPNAGSTFTGWGGDCASFQAAPTCSLTMTAASSVIATFTSATVGPDLTGTVSDVRVRCYVSSCKIALQMTLRNQGTAPSGPFHVRYVLSADPLLDQEDTPLRGTEWVKASLSPGATRTVSTFVPWPVPSDLVRGYLLAVIDAGQEVGETDETNNVAVFRIP